MDLQLLIDENRADEFRALGLAVKEIRPGVFVSDAKDVEDFKSSMRWVFVPSRILGDEQDASADQSEGFDQARTNNSQHPSTSADRNALDCDFYALSTVFCLDIEKIRAHKKTFSDFPVVEVNSGEFRASGVALKRWIQDHPGVVTVSELNFRAGGYAY